MTGYSLTVSVLALGDMAVWLRNFTMWFGG